MLSNFTTFTLTITMLNLQDSFESLNILKNCLHNAIWAAIALGKAISGHFRV